MRCFLFKAKEVDLQTSRAAHPGKRRLRNASAYRRGRFDQSNELFLATYLFVIHNAPIARPKPPAMRTVRVGCSSTDVRIEFAKSAKRSLAVSAAASIVVFAVSAILSGDGVVVSKSDGDGMVSSCLGDRIGDSPRSRFKALAKRKRSQLSSEALTANDCKQPRQISDHRFVSWSPAMKQACRVSKRLRISPTRHRPSAFGASTFCT